MTDNDNALVEEVQNWAEVLRMMHRGGDIGTDDPATCMDKAADRIEAQAAEIERLREALRRSREGWENAIELGLIPERHRNTAQILAEEARAALGDWKSGAGKLGEQQ